MGVKFFQLNYFETNTDTCVVFFQGAVRQTSSVLQTAVSPSASPPAASDLSSPGTSGDLQTAVSPPVASDLPSPGTSDHLRGALNLLELSGLKAVVDLQTTVDILATSDIQVSLVTGSPEANGDIQVATDVQNGPSEPVKEKPKEEVHESYEKLLAERDYYKERTEELKKVVKIQKETLQEREEEI